MTDACHERAAGKKARTIHTTNQRIAEARIATARRQTIGINFSVTTTTNLHSLQLASSSFSIPTNDTSHQYEELFSRRRSSLTFATLFCCPFGRSVTGSTRLERCGFNVAVSSGGAYIGPDTFTKLITTTTTFRQQEVNNNKIAREHPSIVVVSPARFYPFGLSHYVVVRLSPPVR